MKPQEQSAALRTVIERIAAESKTAAIGVALHDLENDFRFAINAERRFHAASTIKVAILLAVFRAIDERHLRADDPLHVRNRFLSAVENTPFHLEAESDGFPELYRSVGRTAKIASLAECMITASSNLATNLLLDFVTVDYAANVLRDAGIHGVDLRRGVADDRAHEQGLNNEITADGLLALFAALRSDFLSKTSRDLAISILLKQRFTSMIPAPLPAHATVAHKTGEISTACHDAGIIYFPERQPYLLAILTEVNERSENRRETVANISKAVFQCVTGEEIAL